jgi:hypothetical protein
MEQLDSPTQFIFNFSVLFLFLQQGCKIKKYSLKYNFVSLLYYFSSSAAPAVITGALTNGLSLSKRYLMV